MNIHQYYNNKSEEFRTEQKRVEKQSFYMYLMRLFSFIGFIALVVLFVYSGYNYWYLSSAVIMLLLFLCIVQWDFKLSIKRKLIENFSPY